MKISSAEELHSVKVEYNSKDLKYGLGKVISFKGVWCIKKEG